MTNRLTRKPSFIQYDSRHAGELENLSESPRKAGKISMSQSSRNRVIPAVLPMISVVLPQETAISGGVRHGHIWDFCHLCPQYAHVVVFSRKCYYEAQCPIPGLFDRIFNHSPRTARPQSSIPRPQCMLPETISHPSLDTENHAHSLCAEHDNLSPPTGSTSAKSSVTSQNSPPKVRYRSTRPLASCLCVDEVRRKAYQERVSGERESRGVSSMRMYTAYVRIGREGVTLSFEC